MDKIFINNLEIIAFHGVLEEEKKLGQKFLISAEMSVSTREAAKTDDVSKTVNYAEVANDIKKILTADKFDLIETCAEKVARHILLNYSLVQEIKITIKKPWAPLQMHFENVAVEISRKRHKAYISLGSNIGEKKENIDKAISLIGDLEDTKVLRESSIIETEPFGYLDQENFMNSCIEISTLMTAEELLKVLLSIEEKLGRKRTIKWGPRIIDLDIIFFDKEIIEEEELNIPHPWMSKRLFVLEPLVELVPNFIHPLFRKPLFMLRDELVGESK